MDGKENHINNDKRKPNCLLCGGLQTVEEFLDLGCTALANKFLSQEETFPSRAEVSIASGFLPYMPSRSANGYCGAHCNVRGLSVYFLRL